jgi:hypothetical protein
VQKECALITTSLSVAQIKSAVPKAKGQAKDAIKLSAIENGTLAQLRNLHKLMGLGITVATDRDKLANELSLAWGLDAGGAGVAPMVQPRAKRAKR